MVKRYFGVNKRPFFWKLCDVNYAIYAVSLSQDNSNVYRISGSPTTQLLSTTWAVESSKTNALFNQINFLLASHVHHVLYVMDGQTIRDVRISNGIHDLSTGSEYYVCGPNKVIHLNTIGGSSSGYTGPCQVHQSAYNGDL